jgi:UDP-sugar transporter A1/2/3
LVNEHYSFFKFNAGLAVIYAVTNVLSYVNLTLVSPGLFRLVINSKILFSALVAVMFLKRTLTSRHWFALALLSVGCSVASYGGGVRLYNIHGVLLVVLQGALSSIAGAWNEYLLKNSRCPFVVQSMFLYFWSVIINFAVGAMQQLYTEGSISMFQNFTPIVAAIVLVNAIAGFSTSILLSVLSSLVKEFAQAAMVVLTLVLSVVLFDMSITAALVIGTITVLLAMFLFQNPRDWWGAVRGKAGVWFPWSRSGNQSATSV